MIKSFRKSDESKISNHSDRPDQSIQERLIMKPLKRKTSSFIVSDKKHSFIHTLRTLETHFNRSLYDYVDAGCLMPDSKQKKLAEVMSNHDVQLSVDRDSPSDEELENDSCYPKCS